MIRKIRNKWVLFLFLVITACDGGSSGSNNQENVLEVIDSQRPTVVRLVSASTIDSDRLTLDWFPAEDDETPSDELTYIVHLSETSGFQPSSATDVVYLTGEVSAVVSGLKAGTQYYARVVARDSDGWESWSNQLQARTAEVGSRRTSASVRVQTDQQNPDKTEGSISYNSDDVTPNIDDYVISSEEGGYVRKVKDVETAQDRVTVTTDPASLNEIFEDLEFSANIKLESPGQAPRTSTTKNSFQVRSTPTQKEAHWGESGLTLIDTNKNQSSQSVVSKLQPQIRGLDINDGWQTNVGEYARFKGQAYAAIEPGIPFTTHVEVELNNKGQQERLQVCKIEMEEFTHKDKTKRKLQKPQVGEFLPSNAEQKGKLTIHWNTNENHVHEGGLPYYATFKAYLDKKVDNCATKTYGLSHPENPWGWEEQLEIKIPIYVTMGESAGPRLEQKIFRAVGGFSVTNTMDFSYVPEYQVFAKISGAKLKQAEMHILSDINIKNTLEINSSGAAILAKRDIAVLSPRKFIKVFTVGVVPIVVSGEFSIKANIEGNVTGAMNITKEINLAFPESKLGLSYDDSSGWKPVSEFTPEYSFQIEGEANARADIKLTLVPDFQIHFYDSASGRLLLEPYIFGEVGLQGNFEYYRDTNNILADADYSFNKLEAGVGLDSKFYAGLHIFDYNIVSYPRDTKINEIGRFETRSIISRENGTLLALPEISVSQDFISVSDEDSRAIKIVGHATDHSLPFGSSSLNPWQSWDEPKIISQSEGAEITPNKRTGNGEYWATVQRPGTYTVRLAGHSKVGWFVRQVKESTFVISDSDSDGMPDYWEDRFNVSESSADDDGDGLTNLEEFQIGRFPLKKDSPNSGDTIFCTAGTPDSQSCPISHGEGNKQRTCLSNGKAWSPFSSCKASSCDAGYSLSGNICLTDDDQNNKVCDAGDTSTRSCSILNGIGEEKTSCSADGKSWGEYGVCEVLRCDAGYSPFGNNCIEDVVDPERLPPPVITQLVETFDTVVLYWNEISSADEFELHLVDLEGSDERTASANTLNSGAIGKLAPKHKYKIRVKAGKNGIFGDYSEFIEFTTKKEVEPGVPTVLIYDIKGLDAYLAWNPVDNADRYRVRVYDLDGDDNRSEYVDTNVIVFKGLNPGHKYRFKVKARVNGEYGGYSDYDYFDVDEVIDISPDITSITPNPAQGLWSRQFVMLNGTNFESGSSVKWKTSSGSSGIVSSERTSFVNSNQIQIYVTLGANSPTWSFKVVLPDGKESGWSDLVVNRQ